MFLTVYEAEKARIMYDFYYPAGKDVLVLGNPRKESTPVVGVAALDGIIDSGVLPVDLYNALLFRNATRNAESFETLTVREASERDLRGWVVYYRMDTPPREFDFDPHPNRVRLPHWIAGVNVRFVPSKGWFPYYDMKRIKGTQREFLLSDYKGVRIDADQKVLIVKPRTEDSMEGFEGGNKS